MRIAYKNIVDDASAITAYSELSSYPVENVQDQRLSTRWISDSTTSQNIVLTFPTFPEYPDNPSGTTYFQGAWATVDGWSVTNGALSVASGILRNSPTTTQSVIYRQIVTVNGKTLRARARASKPCTITVQYYDVVTKSIANFNVGTEWVLLDCYLASGSTNNYVYYNSGNTLTAGDWVEYDWIYVGDGTYSTQLTDLSGNGNHGTVYGAIPQADGSLSFDGVNDYVTIGNFLMPSISTFMVLFPRGSPTTTVQKTILNIGVTSAPFFWLYRQANNTALVLSYWNGTSAANIQIASFFDNFTSSSVNLICEITWSTGLVKVYRNGLLYQSTSITTPSLPSIGTLNVGRYQTGLYYFDSYIKSIRIYNRALSEQEITSLYSEKPFASEYLGLVGDWTLDKPYKVNTAAVLGHNIKSGTVVSVQANNSDEWSDPPFSTTFSYIASDATILKYLSSTYNYKYWRFTFSGQGDIEVGRLWLGEYLQINPASSLDFSVIKKTDDTVVYGKGRQKYASIGNKWRRIELRFPRSDANMVTAIERMYDEVGRHSSFIFTNFDSLREYPLVEPLYGSFTDDVQFSHTNRMKYTYDLAIEEDL